MTRRRIGCAVVAMATIIALASCAGGDDDGAGAGWERVDSATLEQRMASEDVYLVNVHVPYEGEIPGTDAFIPYTEITDRLDELPDDGTLVIYCRSGNMSTQSAQEMVDAGFSEFAELEGGFQAWKAAGLPFENDAA